MDYYLYRGKAYHCSEITTEGELYGADCSYGSGDTLLLLDELGYVSSNDCVPISESIWCRFMDWIKSLGRKPKKCVVKTLDGDGFDFIDFQIIL